MRAAIDTNLCLVSEVASEEVDESALQRWFGNYRGTSVARFPFAVLEIKLALDDADDLPGWVKPIVDDLVPVHKFSKYMPVFLREPPRHRADVDGVGRAKSDFHTGIFTAPPRSSRTRSRPCPTGPTSRPSSPKPRSRRP